jgi:plastocyanin
MGRILSQVAALSLVILLLLAPTAGAQGQTRTVNIKNFAFDQPKIMVAPGTKVTWVNNDQTPHTATATKPAGAFDSGTLQPGQRYSFTFDQPGTYTYQCVLHPFMTGTVTVVDGSAPAGPITTQPVSSVGFSLGGPIALALLAISGVIAILVLRRSAS